MKLRPTSTAIYEFGTWYFKAPYEFVMEEGREFIISGIMLRKGNNIIEFNTSGSLETIDSALHNGDMRMVSIGLRNVSLELSGGRV